ncbi:MAG: methyltransferase domain-containing protein [Ignavibacteriales bacterium]|nr:methyltransferase domain-containing protein [Ignavibacteriales bacterium]
MAIVAPTANKEELRERIFNAVQDMYSEVASCPSKGFHFLIGRPACEYVGYPAKELDAIPSTAVESFAGVGYPFRANVLQREDTVCDIGSGAGTDLLISSLKVGHEGKVYGIDFTDAMIEKARTNIRRMEAYNAEVLKGNAEAIPLPRASVDVVTSNGVLNLVPDKHAAFKEIYRILKPEGHIQISDIVLGKDLSEKCRSNPQLWAECIVGAMPEQAFLDVIQNCGFTDLTILQRMDYFESSPSESTKSVARQYGAIAITITGKKQ